MVDGPSLVPMAVCEDCWLIDHSHWEPDSMDDEGNVSMRLTGVDLPETICAGSVEICALCGSITISGIYAFKDPSKAYFTKDADPPQFEIDMQEYGDEAL
jgi:hypothetical protein